MVCQDDEMMSPTFLPKRVQLSLVLMWSRTWLKNRKTMYLQEILYSSPWSIYRLVRPQMWRDQKNIYIFLACCEVCVVVCHCVPPADRGTSGGEGRTGWGWECHQHEKAAIRCFLFLFPIVCLGGSHGTSQLLRILCFLLIYIFRYISQSRCKDLSISLCLYLVTLSGKLTIKWK